MIRKTDDGVFVISSHRVWRPGVYESERAARYALRFDDEVLQRLQAAANAREADPDKAVITFEDLRRARAAEGGKT